MVSRGAARVRVRMSSEIKGSETANLGSLNNVQFIMRPLATSFLIVVFESQTLMILLILIKFSGHPEGF